MTRDNQLALRALHEVLVAARSIWLEQPGNGATAAIVDSVEAVPLWIADSQRDWTDELVALLEALAAEYPACGMAAATAQALKRRE